MEYLIVFIAAVITWMVYEYRHATFVDETPNKVHWDDNKVHTEQDF